MFKSPVPGLGKGVAAWLQAPNSANLALAITDETGSGALVFATSPSLVTPALGTPSSANLVNATGLPISTGVSGLGANVATFLATPNSSNLIAAVTDETGTGALVFGTGPTITGGAITGFVDPTGLLFKKASAGTTTISMQDGVPTTTTSLSLSATKLSLTENAAPIEFSANTNGGITNQLLLNTDGSITLGYGQLTFPATQVPSADPNTLDDYEEGTWTPIDSSGAGLTFTGVSASYTKIGNTVRAGAWFTYPSTADASSAVVGGLPFSSANANYARQAFVTASSEATLASMIPAASATTLALLTSVTSNISNATMSLDLVVFTAIYPVS